MEVFLASLLPLLDCLLDCRFRRFSEHSLPFRLLDFLCYSILLWGICQVLKKFLGSLHRLFSGRLFFNLYIASTKNYEGNVNTKPLRPNWPQQLQFASRTEAAREHFFYHGPVVPAPYEYIEQKAQRLRQS